MARDRKKVSSNLLPTPIGSYRRTHFESRVEEIPFLCDRPPLTILPLPPRAYNSGRRRRKRRSTKSRHQKERRRAKKGRIDGEELCMRVSP